jgi:hypothetical protein
MSRTVTLMLALAIVAAGVQRLWAAIGNAYYRHHRPMTCAARSIAAATITAGLLVTAASAATQTEPFTAAFHARQCGARFCGTGVIDHYGPATIIIVASLPTPGPEPGCITFKGTTTAKLAKNSTLRFAFQGSSCGPRNNWGTFRIVSGTGTFANASGSGVSWVDPVGLLHYYGVIRLGG